MIGILFGLVIVGVVLYLVEVYVPMSPPIKTILRIVVVLVIVAWLLSLFGLLDMPVPRVR